MSIYGDNLENADTWLLEEDQKATPFYQTSIIPATESALGAQGVVEREPHPYDENDDDNVPDEDNIVYIDKNSKNIEHLQKHTNISNRQYIGKKAEEVAKTFGFTVAVYMEDLIIDTGSDTEVIISDKMIFAGDVVVRGGGSLTFEDDVTIRGNLTTESDVVCESGGIHVEGDAEVDGNFYAGEGAIIIGGDFLNDSTVEARKLYVGGDLSAKELSVSGQTIIKGKLEADIVEVNRSLEVGKDIIVDKLIAMSDVKCKNLEAGESNIKGELIEAQKGRAERVVLPQLGDILPDDDGGVDAGQGKKQ